MTEQPSKDVLRSSAVQSMNYHIEVVDRLTESSAANAVIRDMLASNEINVPAICGIDSDDRVDVIASLASVISELHGCLKFIHEMFPELQDARPCNS